MRSLLAALLLSLPATACAEDAGELAEKALAAWKQGKSAEALQLAEAATKADAKSPFGPYATGLIRAGQREPVKAIAAFDVAIQRDPNFTAAYDRRGDAKLKAGQFQGAVEDFDVFLKANPKYLPEHWRRGIALYYAGKFDEGVKQFDIHRTVNPEDVENSAWHYLCNVKANGKAKAVQDLIPVSKDARVPMAQVLELFAGKLKPEDVLKAAEMSGLKDKRLTSARFYAHLYVALYYDGEGKSDKVKEHLKEAVKLEIPDYMWDVAKAHLEQIEKK